LSYLAKDLSFEDWHEENNELVRHVDLIRQGDAEKKIEKDILDLGLLLGLRLRVQSRSGNKTSDFTANNIDSEVSAVHPYIPRSMEIDYELKEYSKDFSTCKFLYMYSDKNHNPKINLVGSKK
jgi:hypothetical protein